MYLQLLRKKIIQKTAEAPVNLIGNKTANKITSLKDFTTEYFKDS